MPSENASIEYFLARDAIETLTHGDLYGLKPQELGSFWKLRLSYWKNGSIPASPKRLARFCGSTEKQIGTLLDGLGDLFEPHPEIQNRLIISFHVASSQTIQDFLGQCADRMLRNQELLRLNLREFGVFSVLRCFCWKDGSVYASPKQLARMTSTSEQQMIRFLEDFGHLLDTHSENSDRMIMPLVEEERSLAVEADREYVRLNDTNDSIDSKAKGDTAKDLAEIIRNNPGATLFVGSDIWRLVRAESPDDPFPNSEDPIDEEEWYERNELACDTETFVRREQSESTHGLGMLRAMAEVLSITVVDV